MKNNDNLVDNNRKFETWPQYQCFTNIEGSLPFPLCAALIQAFSVITARIPVSLKISMRLIYVRTTVGRSCSQEYLLPTSCAWCLMGCYADSMRRICLHRDTLTIWKVLISGKVPAIISEPMQRILNNLLSRVGV